ncbi:MAG: alpha/beta fold hydrolase, partial [Alphaproteobacteria bacterium]
MNRWISMAAALALAASAAQAEEEKGGQAMAQPQSIDEGLFVPINGEEQWITIRGHDLKNPVLLFLHGGPGFPTSGQAPLFFDWEKDFTIVQWDQPGGGATYAKNMAKGEGPLTRTRYTKDGIAVAEFVRDHLHTDKMVLMGISWGTELGLRMIHERPELFSAYVGTAQVVDSPRGNKLGYELALKAARERGDKTAIAELEKAGPPPYKKFEDFLVRQKYVFPPGLPASPEEKAATAKFAKILSAPPPPDAHYIAKDVPQYDYVKQFLAVQAEV